ncbi:BspA family leucine-rich repeat surface protein [uncultured Aquimarina sp.]|uniref:BspA family leucine-rich repeat surface protein n=1 Tax=uncultured Aquimarina sp. TaxID=575652 RepID=UPI0026242492|nr:BspA family leucine-rich repeat surface protein [uncultured Aquimarina sp.]
MKHIYTTLFFIVSFFTAGFAQNEFITTWQTTTADEDITIPTTGAGYNYIVDWGDGTAITSETGNATHTYTSAGAYEVKIVGDFPRIYFNNTGDKDKILEVNQWGTQQWTSMENAFNGCTNLVLNATDTPILSEATNISRMFRNASSLVDTQDVMNTWDVSTITTMERMFANADMFDENIASWNVGNVQDFSLMFFGTDNFNQNVNDWNIGAFVTGVVNIDFMFAETASFNQPLNRWDITKIDRFDFTFSGAAKFNQDLSDWDLSNVKRFRSAFSRATAFNQNLGDWDISNVNGMVSMLNDSGMSTENYDATLKGWATDTSGDLNDGIDDIPTGVRLGARRLKYCAVAEGRAILTNTLNNWQILDDTLDCGFDEGFITTWQTTAADETIVIPTRGDGYNYSVAWGDGTEDTNITGDASHIFTTPGTYTVKIKGDFPRIYINGNFAVRDKIISVDQWGTQQWTSMESAFRRCSLLVINATDAPDLSLAKSMERMFDGTSSLVDHGGSMGNWDVSTIEDMRSVFLRSSFNENISAWNVSAVKDFTSMFSGNSSFNQNLGSWNTSAGEVFSSMFKDATAFNGAIGSWNTEKAISLSNMFSGATVFNQDISAWDVKNVGNINNAFDGATAFDQDLGSWDISSLAENTNSIQHMFSNSGMSTENYDNTLIGWARLDTGETKIPVGVSFDAENVSYCLGEAARTILTSAPYDWIITDGGKVCPEDAFITSWLLEDNDRIRIKTTSGYNYNYTIDWGDGTVDYNVTTDILHDYTTAGRYEVSITGEFPRFTLFFRLGRTLRTKIQTIEQWGNIQWRSFRDSFNGCENLKLNADDTPDLSQVTELSSMFDGCTNFEDLKDRMGSWDMSTIESIESMFAGCSIFNEDIGAWTFTNLLTAEAAFEEAITFNQNISNWNMATVTDMENMFYNADAFNQPVDNWTLGMVEDMKSMFAGATTFNQDVSSWNFSQVQDIEELFSGASSFDQDLSSWDISSVTDMTGIFLNSGLSQENYDATLIGWATLESGETQIPASLTLDADVAHCLSVDAVNTLTSATYNWTINDLGNSCPGEAFITTWTVADGGQIMIPNFSMFIAHNYNVDWGDGTFSTANTSSTSHTYVSGGTYTVSITGNMPTIFFGTASDTTKESLQTIEQWGNQKWEYLSAGFAGCVNLKLNADDTPDLSEVSSKEISSMFSGCTNFEDLKDNIGNWDMSQIEDISFMFFNCAVFNEDISTWSFDNLTYTTNTFSNALSFNQDISNWDMSNLERGIDMLKGASSFNHNLAGWDLSSLANDLEEIFVGTALSQENYDNTLIGWATLEAGETQIPIGNEFSADATYCLGEAARDTLTGTTYNWIINDGGLGCVNPVITLLGDDPQIIEKGDTYTELGAEVTYGATLTINSTSVNTNQVSSYTVTYDATNMVSGATATQVTRTVDIVDTTAPVITLNGANPQTIELGAGYTELGATTDDGSSVSINASDFVDAVGSYTIYYDATDAAGNVAVQVTRTVNVVDTTNPTVVCQNITVQLDDTGNASITAGMIDNGSTDLSGIASLTIDITDFDCTNIGDNVVVLTVTDANGNSDMCMAIITVIDTIDPEFDAATVPTDMEVIFDSGNMYTLGDFTSGVVVTDNCDTNRTALATIITQNPVPGTLLGVGDHVIILTATDENANEQTTTFTITVTDAILSVGENREEVFTLYPNPAKDQVWITRLNGEAQVTLLDINGRTLRTAKVVSDQAVSTRDLSEGVYLITIEQDGIHQTIRFIKN